MNFIHISFYLLSITAFASGISGCYKKANSDDDSHFIQISWDENENTFTWANRAGTRWSLKLVDLEDTTKLAVQDDCPFYNSGHKFAGLEWQGIPGKSQLSTISGPDSEVFQRKENCTQGKCSEIHIVFFF